MRHLVTIQKIEEIKPIKDADKIEAARINGWWVVVLKGFNVGDKVLYFEVDSFLPVKPEYDFLLRGSSPKKMLMDGKEVEGIRLKTIKLKGTLSQGLILPIPEVLLNLEVGEDVTERLDVIKYEAPVPVELSGIMKGNFPCFIPKTDEERIQNMPSIFSGFYVTEKIDGTSVTFYKKDGVFGVCSRNIDLLEGNTTQWRIAKELKLEEILPDNFSLQGELIGEGIQKNPLKIHGQKVYFFNAYNIEAGISLVRMMNLREFIHQ
jgi:RNA ligase (TIGR02306 family)